MIYSFRGVRPKNRIPKLGRPVHASIALRPPGTERGAHRPVILEMVRVEPKARKMGAFLRTPDWGLHLAQDTAQNLVRRFASAFSRKIQGKRSMNWETVLLRNAQRFAEEVASERRKSRPFSFELHFPDIQPATMSRATLTAKSRT